MFYIIGLGLSDENDLPIKAIDAAKMCDEVFCELYTGKWLGNLKKLEKMTGKKINMLERIQVESEMLIEKAKKSAIALLVPGDPLTATTHFELILEARKHKIRTKVIHASSIYTAVAETGLQLYKFGRTTTVVYPEERFKPASPYEIIAENQKAGLHTLILLDIRQEEEKYMSVPEGLEILFEIEDGRKKNIITSETKFVACCQLGSDSRIIKYDKIKNLIRNPELKGKIPAVLVLPGKMHFREEEALNLWA